MANQYSSKAKENRDNAIKEGRKFYEGSVPCKNCGSYEKYVSNSSCRQCIVSKGLKKLNDNELMSKYRTKEKQHQKYLRYKDSENRKAVLKKYNQSEKGKITNLEKSARRRARARDQIPEDVDFDKIKEIYAECKRISDETGIPHEVDHIIPIAAGGLHHHDNLQILTREENRKKGSNIL